MKPDSGVDAEDLKVTLLTQEIKFAKMLAGNEFNVTIKEKHIKKLGNWLKNRSACSQVFTDKDCMRIWKGLFFSMWMSDKPLPQESLATKIAALLHSFDQIESCLQFYAMFLKTMALEWNGIDQWRIDKFMMLVRKVTREMLSIIQSKDWDAEIIAKFATQLNETVLSEGTPRGLFMHFVELFFEEVGKVSNGDIEPESVTNLLRPFMLYVASQKDYKLIHCVNKHVFNYLLFQSETGREYSEKYDAWKSMGFPGNSLEEMELEEETNESNDDDDEEDDDEDEENDEEKDEGEPTALDPRAGRVNVVMAEIKFNPTEIAEAIEELKYKKFTRMQNRKCITRIVNAYKTFASGVFPLGIKRLKIDRNELQLPDADDKAIEMLSFEDKLFEKTRALKKMNKRKRKKMLAPTSTTFNGTAVKRRKLEIIKREANTWLEEDIPDDVDVNLSGSSKKAKQPKAVNGFQASHEVTPAKPKSPAKQSNSFVEDDNDEIVPAKSSAKKQRNSKRFDDIPILVPIDSNKSTESPGGKPHSPKESPKHNSFKESPKHNSSKLIENESTPIASAKKLKKLKVLNSTPIASPKLPIESPNKSKLKLTTPQQSPAILNISQTKSVESPKAKKKSPKWEEPLGEGETEYFIPSKKAKANGVQSTSFTKEAVASPKAHKIKLPKSAQSTPQMDRVAALKNASPKSLTTSAEKKVKIMLQMNKSQEAVEYIRQLKQSPSLPFNSSEKPLKGVLKPNLMPSPINPFYQKMIGLNRSSLD